MEPLNNGHGGDEHFVYCSEVVPSSGVEMYGQLMTGASSLSIVGRLSSYQSVHYRRFYCKALVDNETFDTGRDQICKDNLYQLVE